MFIKEVSAKSVKDSRGERTIQVSVYTPKGKFFTSAPAGKSTGKYEVKSYAESLDKDIEDINELDIEDINGIIEKEEMIKSVGKVFEILKNIEIIIDGKIGGNSLFAFEASLLKAFACENGKELWDFLLDGKKIKFPRPVGNAIGGGLHSKGKGGKKPDFQEFLFIADCKSFSECVRLNELAYKLAGKKLGFFKRRNDEGAWETGLSNEEVLDIIKSVKSEIRDKYNKKVDIGIDVAASSFFKDSEYIYNNFHKELNRNSQISYIAKIAKKFGIFYLEDPFEENDFNGFSQLMFELNKTNCLVVGDDLTVTDPERLKKAIRMRAINAIIVKPNQIGSLLKVKEVIALAKKNGIKTIISHRSGETKDNTIADLGVGFGCDFIKTGIYGSVRKVKLKRIEEIERRVMVKS